jgi:hypothetical protein
MVPSAAKDRPHNSPDLSYNKRGGKDASILISGGIVNEMYLVPSREIPRLPEERVG